MNDPDTHTFDFGMHGFDDIGHDNLKTHRGNDFEVKCKPEKCIIIATEGRHQTSTWYENHHAYDNDTRYPQQEFSREGHFDKSSESHENSQGRDLPPYDPTFGKRCTIPLSEDSKKRYASDQTQDDAVLAIKKQCVSPPLPEDDEKDGSAEAFNGYSSLSILQSWSSGTLMSDKQNASLSEQTSSTQGDHAQDRNLISQDFVSCQHVPFSESSLSAVLSQDIKLKHPHCLQTSRGNQSSLSQDDGKFHRSFTHGPNVQQLLHEDRVKDFIGERQGRLVLSNQTGWDNHQPQWRFPHPHESNYRVVPMTNQPWDRFYPYHQSNYLYGSVDQRGAHARSIRTPYHPSVFTAVKPSKSILILALPEDRASLSEVLCLVRENIEVFSATEDEIKAPAPGRKRPVFEGQVGFRCVHCRWSANQYDRVKRAACYPSSLQRIYRTIIDMKLDHFKACKYVPIHLKMKLDELMCSESRSTGTTMQYMVWAAKKLGMIDSEHGIRFSSPDVDSKNRLYSNNGPKKWNSTITQPDSLLERDYIISTQAVSKPSAPEDNCLYKLGLVTRNETSVSKNSSDYETNSFLEKPCLIQDASFSLSMDLSFDDGVERIAVLEESKSDDFCTPIRSLFHGKVSLALPEDRTALTPLRCFLRQNVCAFSATSEDVIDRSATTIVTEGQVGIACLHCMRLPSKERSNRSMCFPFTVSRIYQAVADIQRFHLNECKMVPSEIKEKFFEYQSLSAKGSKGLATRQYWITSAQKLGLIDTPHGIRFSRDPSLPIMQVNRKEKESDECDFSPLVLPEDKGTIAEFLYLTMLQLKPCRFKEADRNKRRLKDVGCKGVECRHCAGLVDGRKFFWSSVNAVESNFVSVHTHVIECKMVPQSLKDELIRLKALRKEQTSQLKNGSQKAFFLRVWQRLHPDGSHDIPSTPSSPVRLHSHINEPRFTFMPHVTPSQATIYDTSSLYHTMSPSNKFIHSSYHLNDPRNRFWLQSDVYDLSLPRIDSIEADNENNC